MLNTALGKMATVMIYIGTCLLSVLSFYTTYYGLMIMVPQPLALIGSLGLQVAMLGTAWSLMKVKESRLMYTVVFTAAASFSIFFSYANFNISLKEDTRAQNARGEYTAVVRPALAEYSATAGEAILKGRYQMERLDKLIEMELNQGWSTVVDEGTNDPFIQNVIDGARRTVASWAAIKGADYHQGPGRGIIANYLESHTQRVQSNIRHVVAYNALVDSLSLLLNSDLTVAEQYNLVNHAWVAFPKASTDQLLSNSTEAIRPPDMTGYVEYPENKRQAFMLIIGDLLALDSLAVFAMLLAIAIDLIVIVMAFAGSMIIDDVDFYLQRVRQDGARRVRDVTLDSSEDVAVLLSDNLDRLNGASQYSLDLMTLLAEHKNKKKLTRITLRRGPEIGETVRTTGRAIVNRIGAMSRWTWNHLPMNKKNNDLIADQTNESTKETETSEKTNV